MTPQNYKNIIIGSGEGGKYLAWHLAQSGEQTVVIERRWIGVSCPDVNCLPSKNEIWSAKGAHLVHHAGRFGSAVSDHPSAMAAVRGRKREMVEGLIAMHLDKYKASGAELVMGEARLTSSNTLEVRLNDGGTRTLVGPGSRSRRSDGCRRDGHSGCISRNVFIVEFSNAGMFNRPIRENPFASAAAFRIALVTSATLFPEPTPPTYAAFRCGQDINSFCFGIFGKDSIAA